MNPAKENLEHLFNENYDCVKDYTLEKLINEYIDEMNHFYLSMGMTNYLRDQEVVDLKKALKNKELIVSFENVINLNVDEDLIISEFVSDINKSVIALKKEIAIKKPNFKNQIIFIEHDQLLSGYFCGFGEGDYPILSQPEYIKFDYHKELYSGIGFIDYKKVSANLFSFDLILENLDLENYISFSNFYECLQESYKYKIYLLLNKAFNQIGIEVFDGIDVKKPLYIYGNERNCESINIIIYN
jgi:predicted DNA-binding protein